MVLSAAIVAGANGFNDFINCVVHRKGSEFHKVAVVRDKGGDSLQDTSCPAFNILLKLMSVVAREIAPFIKI